MVLWAVVVLVGNKSAVLRSFLFVVAGLVRKNIRRVCGFLGSYPVVKPPTVTAALCFPFVEWARFTPRCTLGLRIFRIYGELQVMRGDLCLGDDSYR